MNSKSSRQGITWNKKRREFIWLRDNSFLNQRIEIYFYEEYVLSLQNE